MKRIASLLVVLVVTLATVVPSFAEPPKGAWGVGYHGPDFPLGIRWWVSDKVGLDFGLGFSNDPFNDTGDNKTTWGIEFGAPIVLAGMGDETNFYIRPGIDYRSIPNPILGGPAPNPDNDETIFGITGQLGVEHWFAKRFSVQVAEGVAFYNVDPGVGSSHTVFQTQAFGISNIGFHYYFGGGK
jgi:hypothetical protein